MSTFLQSCALAVLLMLPVPVAIAQDTPGDAVADLLRGPIDPYLKQAERNAFLKASGVDNDLEEAEFKAAGEKGGGFARVFDRWAAVKKYDKNNDGRIDWAEADEYRQALRKAVIVKYDADRNRKLEGAERDAANRDLAAGKAPNIAIGAAPSPTPAPAPPPTPGRPNRQPFNPFGNDPNMQFNPKFDDQGRLSGLPKEMIAQIDTDGDGLVSQAERLDAANRFYGMGKDALLKEYDKDGDGVLSAAEREAMISPVQFLMDIHDTYKLDYDEDGDGTLGRDEQAAIDNDLQAYLKMAEKNQLKVMDADHDGVVSPKEMQEMQTKAQFAMIQLAPKAMSWVDADGNGNITEEEGFATFNRFRGTFNEKVKELRTGADADGDGRLNAPERAALMQTMLAGDEALITKHDADADGQLNANELAALYEEAAEFWGIKPKATR